MRINNEFTVHAPIDRAWALLTDVEAIAPCMPGAQLTGIRLGEAETVGETYEGKVKVKLGPVVAEYKGTAVFIEKDDEKFRGIIDAKGRDSRGAGNASALITVQLRSAGEGTTVGIDTELKISGKIAQFGAGMIQEVSEKLLGQFVGCLEGKLAAPAEAEPVATEPLTTEPVATDIDSDSNSAKAPKTVANEHESMLTEAALGSALASSAADPALASAADVIAANTPAAGVPVTPINPPASTSPAGSTPAAPTRRTFQASPEPEALDLLGLAGGAAFKRLVPAAIGGAAVLAVVIFIVTRR